MTESLIKQALVEQLLRGLGGFAGKGVDLAGLLGKKLLFGGSGRLGRAGARFVGGLPSDIASLGHVGLGSSIPAMPLELAKHVAKKPIARGVLGPLATYYGAEAASAPFASDDTMKGMRENYWGSVAADAGDAGSSGHNRLVDWLTRPGRTYRAGGAQNTEVPNLAHGNLDGLFTQLQSQPGTYSPSRGATNETQIGVRQAPLSNYQKAQQVLARQAEKARIGNYEQMRAKDQPLLQQSQQAQHNFQSAFPQTAIPKPKALSGPSFSQLLGQGVAEDIPAAPKSNSLQAIYDRWK